MQTKNLEKTISQIFDGSNKYIVPLYQRNFAWRQEQIEQLLQDVYEAYDLFRNNKGGRHYFIGSLVVLRRNNGDLEVIDGQQRLTTLSLITKIIGINREPRLYYDSRPEVEDFFRDFYKSDNNDVKVDYPQTFHLKNAIEIICNATLNPNDTSVNMSNISDDFKRYFANNVYLVQVEIPEDTDVAAYFEIMNNRGEQLQKHEILKSLLIEKLQGNRHRQDEFARIWDACSQMNIPIQKLFDSKTRKWYFGNNYDSFEFKGLSSSDNNDELFDNKNAKTIDEIISTQCTISTCNRIENDNANDNDDDESDYKSIIDFPNFLMHVFKVLFPQKDVKLNEKFLISTYNELEKYISPDDFIVKLFYLRTMFDRYIVKTIVDKSDNEDGERWTLRKPKNYVISWKYVDTFGLEKTGQAGNIVGSSREQERIIKALSMLQVSYRTRIYKNWLCEILAWFNEQQKIDITYQSYINKIDEIICSKYDEMNFSWKHIENFDQDNYAEGTNTPHILFNLIDYLYWVNDENNRTNNLKPFDFKYWNSVEHHMAREWAERNDIQNKEKFINNLGNLCLISKNSNSRLSDRDVKEKVETFGKGNLGPNRQIIYNMTRENNMHWNEENILTHYNNLVDILLNHKQILGNNNS